ncbi:MAG: hypothetical protein KAI43_14435 [Candidatus Aureabacteria bacterium]|nr:hypothetical protein [Candidatus Auribacterota bacterium]
MKTYKLFYILILSITISSCFSKEKDTFVIIHKNTPFPEPRSFYSLWIKRDYVNKREVIKDIDATIYSDNSISAKAKSEWSFLDIEEKDEYIEDFFFRRKKRLICNSFKNTPFEEYLKSYFSDRFIDEYVQILELSPEFKNDCQKGNKIIYKSRIVIESSKTKPQFSSESKPSKSYESKTSVFSEHQDFKRKSYYEDISNESGITSSSDEESYIKDVINILD